MRIIRSRDNYTGRDGVSSGQGNSNGTGRFIFPSEKFERDGTGRVRSARPVPSGDVSRPLKILNKIVIRPVIQDGCEVNGR